MTQDPTTTGTTSGTASGPAGARRLGRSGIEVSPVGFGAWAIGGPAFRDGNPIGWGEVDDEESVAAVQAALDAGITFFDTASIYGAGHSERVLAASGGAPTTRSGSRSSPAARSAPPPRCTST